MSPRHEASAHATTQQILAALDTGVGPQTTQQVLDTLTRALPAEVDPPAKGHLATILARLAGDSEVMRLDRAGAKRYGAPVQHFPTTSTWWLTTARFVALTDTALHDSSPVAFQPPTVAAPGMDTLILPDTVSATLVTAFDHIPDVDHTDLVDMIGSDSITDLAAVAHRLHLRAQALNRIGAPIDSPLGIRNAELYGLLDQASKDLTAIAANLLGGHPDDIRRRWGTTDTGPTDTDTEDAATPAPVRDPEEEFRNAVTHTLHARYPNDSARPEPAPYTLGPQFLASVAAQSMATKQQLVRCVVDVLTDTRRGYRKISRVDAVRTADQAQAYRCIITNTGGGPRLLWWKIPGGPIELHRITDHDHATM